MTGNASREEYVLEAQVRESLKRVPVTALGSLFNALLAGLSIGGSFDIYTCLWMGGMVILATFRLLHASRASKPQGRAQCQTTANTLTAIALVSGGLWGLLFAYAGTHTNSSQFSLLMMLAGGVTGASIITYSILPKAAHAFVLPLALGGIIGWIVRGGDDQVAAILMILSFTGLMAWTVFSLERVFVTKIENETELRKAADTVKLLLNDYEAQGGDWLWQIDDCGHIVNANDRFAEASAIPKEQLNGTRFASLFGDGGQGDRLVAMLAQGQSFRDFVVPLTINNSQRWWSLSARPNEAGVRGVASDITARELAEKRVRYMAHYDNLTGLANRFLFNASISRALQEQKPSDTIAVITIDLDHFKDINDTQGHPAGDHLLTVVAKRLRESLPESDLIARLGGDEFAILVCTDENIEGIERRALAALSCIAEPVQIEGTRLLVTASIGVVTQTKCLDANQIMKFADLALYSAKAAGRNCFAHFEEGMDERARERHELEMDLRHAISNGELELYYQPLLNLETNEISCCEALVRWNHRTRGLVMPDAFIGLAEETGLIVELGEWVLREACRTAASWPAGIRVAVNLSPIQLRYETFVANVIQALAHSGLAPTRLELEITENVFLGENVLNLEKLHKLRSFGIRIALDDFGTGYSSLNYLRSFPFDKIKVDKCFIEGIGDHPDCDAIIRAVNSIASSLGICTTAEGVEYDHQLRRLREEGCTEIQGYLLSKPRPANLLDLSPRDMESCNSLPRMPTASPTSPLQLSGIKTQKRATG